MAHPNQRPQSHAQQNLQRTVRAGRTVPVQPRRPSVTDSRVYVPVSPQQPPRILSASQRMRAVRLNAVQHNSSPAQRGYAPPPTAPRGTAPRGTAPRGTAPRATSAAPRQKAKNRSWLIIAGLSVVTLMAFTCLALTIGGVVVYSGGILPGVQVGEVNLGGMSVEAATNTLENELQTVTLRDGERSWQVQRAALGLQLDAAATAERAYRQGRGEGDIFSALLGGAAVAPVVIYTPETLTAGLEALKPQVEIPAKNAGVAFENGQVVATPPEQGRLLDINATLQQMTTTGDDGAIILVMTPVQPAITDATPLLEAASQLLANPLSVRVYDPVTGDMVNWSRAPQQWATWITTRADAGNPGGLSISLEDQALRNFLNEEAQVFDASRFLNMDEAVTQIQAAVQNSTTTATIRVYHHDRQHIVQSGETITSIAWDYGVPYPYVQQANPGVVNLTVGQAITIPSPDNFLLYPVVPDKRIVVDISEQRTRVYENGRMIWDWASSTGIASSPTWTGIYQIISHEPNAYAGNWDLWMPNFMGVYQPVPGADFTNGFHGFPTRGGGQLLWENSLGTRVTYGCILLHDDNIAQLYHWAQTGVVVEIRA